MDRGHCLPIDSGVCCVWGLHWGALDGGAKDGSFAAACDKERWGRSAIQLFVFTVQFNHPSYLAVCDEVPEPLHLRKAFVEVCRAPPAQPHRTRTPSRSLPPGNAACQRGRKEYCVRYRPPDLNTCVASRGVGVGVWNRRLEKRHCTIVSPTCPSPTRRPNETCGALRWCYAV